MANKIKVRLIQKIDEVYSEKQRKYMCAMAQDGADRPEGLSQAEAEEMCGDTEYSKKNEARIATKDGDKEVKASRGETEHFFAHKSGKVYIITHKPSGKALPAVVTKYGTKLSDAREAMKDLENANIAGIGDESPSPETLRSIKDVLKKTNEQKELEITDETDMVLPRGQKIVLQADSEDYKRGLIVELLDDGGYEVQYWYNDPSSIYPVEVLVDGESIKDDAKVVKLGFHPELDKNND